MASHDTLLAMRAADAGLDRRLPSDGDWLSFGAAGNRAQLWLRADTRGYFAAAAPADVVVEVGPIAGCEASADSLPPGAAAAWMATTELALDRLCRRIALLGHVLPDAPLRRFEAEVERVLANDPSPRTTERIAEVRRRVGQDQFRAALMEYWGGTCPISGVTEPALLRASHIKPWKVCTDAERLDVHNGLLLAVHLDAAFDAGLISFADDGTMLVSDRLGQVEREVLGVGDGCSIPGLVPAHKMFLRIHRASSDAVAQ